MSAPIRHERVEANGLEFHVNACGEGDRLALCLHGFPELGLSWDAQLPALAGAGDRARVANGLRSALWCKRAMGMAEAHCGLSPL